jgi:hypothetical protein
MVKFAQATFVHKDICPIGRLPRKIFAHTTFAQKNVFAQKYNGTVTYKPRRLPRHQRAQAHNSTPNSRQKIFL